MAYGTIKVDQVTFTNGGVDQTISVSGIVQSISGDITATGTIQGATIIGTSTVSGATVTGDAGQFITATAATGVFTSTLSGATITGNTASFTTITGGTVTLTSGVFASGTAAAPSVSVGTTDNGLYSPGANKVAISTNGTGQLFVDSSGKVGLGTSSPSSLLQIGSTTASTGNVITFGKRVSCTQNNLPLIGHTSSDGDDSSLGICATSSDGIIQFFTGNNSAGFGAGVNNERMRIDSVGTTTLTSANGTEPFVAKIGTSEVVRIDSSGRLLVGTSSSTTVTSFTGSNGAVAFTEQQTSSVSTGALYYRTSDSTLGPRIYLGKSRDTLIVQSDDTLGQVEFGGFDGTNTLPAALIRSEVDGTPGANDMPGRLVFSTTADGASSPTERMRITSGSEVWINTTTGTVNTSNFGTAMSANGNIGLFYTSRDVSGAGTVAGIYGNAGNLFVRGDGDCENTNNSYGAISDIKLKENIVDANSQWDDLKALQVRNYNFKAETGFSTHTQLGLVAQEVELVSPGLVGESINEETGESTKSVNYSVLYMKAVKALQEAMERIEVLEAKVNALEVN